MTAARGWRKIAESFVLPSTCTNSAYILKQIYKRNLLDWENAEHPELSGVHPGSAEIPLSSVIMDYTRSSSSIVSPNVASSGTLRGLEECLGPSIPSMNIPASSEMCTPANDFRYYPCNPIATQHPGGMLEFSPLTYS